jgi:hypothetical protein
MVVAIIALVIAASGTAIATTTRISGDSLIKKGTLSGNRLRRHTLTGTQINLKKLGKVPAAGQADAAYNAVVASSALNATDAGNASMLDGLSASAFESASNVVRSGLVTASAGQTVQVASFGPFTMNMTCTSGSAGSFTAKLQGSSSQDKSDIGGKIVTPAGTSVAVDGTAVSASTQMETSGTADFIAPVGGGYEGSLVNGVNAFGSDCYAMALIVKS